MHPPPPTEDLQFLIGQEIGQVCLDPWSLQFRFSDGGGITAEGPVEHVEADGTVHWHQNGNEQDRGPVYLRTLIQRRISAVVTSPEGVVLTMDDGAQLRIVAEIGPYESAQIYHPDGRAMPLVF